MENEVRNRKIYIHIFPDKSVYIGQISQENLYKRFNYGLGYDKQPEMFELIMHYGWKNVEHVILEEGMMTKEEANKKECDYTLDYFNRGFRVLNKYNIGTPRRYRSKESYVYMDEMSGKCYDSLRAAAEDIGCSHEAVRQSVKNGKPLKSGHKFVKKIIDEEDN